MMTWLNVKRRTPALFVASLCCLVLLSLASVAVLFRLHLDSTNAGGTIELGESSNGQTLHAHVGDTIRVRLPTYQVFVSDTRVLRPVAGLQALSVRLLPNEPKFETDYQAVGQPMLRVVGPGPCDLDGTYFPNSNDGKGVFAPLWLHVDIVALPPDRRG